MAFVTPDQRTDRKTWLAEIILGGQDGLVNILGLTLGLAAAHAANHLIVVGGLAATFAESISMGAVVYTSRTAEKNQYTAVRRRKLDLIRTHPDRARAELARLFAAKGFDEALTQNVAEHLSRDHSVWADTLMAEGTELVPFHHGDIVRQSLVTLGATLVGSIIPLVPFFFVSTGTALGVAVGAAVAVSAVVLFAVGAYSARTTVGHPVKGGAQMAAIGLGAALVGYVIGKLFK